MKEDITRAFTKDKIVAYLKKTNRRTYRKKKTNLSKKSSILKFLFQMKKTYRRNKKVFFKN